MCIQRCETHELAFQTAVVKTRFLDGLEARYALKARMTGDEIEPAAGVALHQRLVRAVKRLAALAVGKTLAIGRVGEASDPCPTQKKILEAKIKAKAGRGKYMKQLNI